MEFVYVGPIAEAIDLPHLGITVAPGEKFEATGELADALLAQPGNFKRTDKPTRKTDSEEK